MNQHAFVPDADGADFKIAKAQRRFDFADAVGEVGAVELNGGEAPGFHAVEFFVQRLARNNEFTRSKFEFSGLIALNDGMRLRRRRAWRQRRACGGSAAVG